MPQGIITFAEQRGGEFKKAALEALATARVLKEQLGGTITAVVVGHGVKNVASLGAHGAETVLSFDAEPLALYSTEGYGWCVEQAVKECDPAAVVISSTTMGRDLAPQVAARLELPMISDCVAVRVNDGMIEAQRPMCAGKVLAWVRAEGPAAVVGVRPNSYVAEESSPGATAEVKDCSFDFGETDIRSRVTEVKAPENAELDVTEADVVVSAGRGIGGPEGFAVIEELAHALGGAVGASRAVVDAGWRDHSAQVGQTGKTVSPKLYIACGISGAIQHIAGMRTSRVIVAINKDPEAPIFKVADYGIVGDLHEVCPALTAAIREVT